jgi:predicted small lipoprotein YifL
MKKYLVLAAVLGIAACGKKEEAAMPAADTTTVAPAPAPAMPDSTAAATDTTMARDTTHKM